MQKDNLSHKAFIFYAYAHRSATLTTKAVPDSQCPKLGHKLHMYEYKLQAITKLT
jgi:hypothetical protein